VHGQRERLHLARLEQVALIDRGGSQSTGSKALASDENITIPVNYYGL